MDIKEEFISLEEVAGIIEELGKLLDTHYQLKGYKDYAEFKRDYDDYKRGKYDHNKRS
jgi:hypothetical protein